MTKFALTLAAAILVGTTFTSTASAGCGGYSSGGYRSTSYATQQRQAKARASARARARAVAQAKARAKAQARAKAKAEAVAAARHEDRKRRLAAKAKSKADKVRVANAAAVTGTLNDATPITFVPQTSASPVLLRTAALTPADADVAPKKPVTAEIASTDSKIDETVTAQAESDAVSTKTERICRKFSAAVGGLIVIPCK